MSNLLADRVMDAHLWSEARVSRYSSEPFGSCTCTALGDLDSISADSSDLVDDSASVSCLCDSASTWCSNRDWSD